jgi:glutaredoxin
MAVKLHRCGNIWLKFSGHPCWRVQKALDDQGVEYEVVPGPWPSRKKRAAVIEGTGQQSYPAIQFEDGSWYREQSKDMERTIRDGKLMEKRAATASA